MFFVLFSYFSVLSFAWPGQEDSLPKSYSSQSLTESSEFSSSKSSGAVSTTSGSTSTSASSSESVNPFLRRMDLEDRLHSMMTTDGHNQKVWQLKDSKITWYPVVRGRRNQPLKVYFTVAQATCQRLGLRLPYTSECRELMEAIDKAPTTEPVPDDLDLTLWCDGLVKATKFNVSTHEIKNEPIRSPDLDGVNLEHSAPRRAFRCILFPRAPRIR